MSARKCQMCHNLLTATAPGQVSSVVSIRTPEGEKIYHVDDLCAAAVDEFILEFMDDVRTGFKNQDEAWKLRKNPHLQKKLEVLP